MWANRWQYICGTSHESAGSDMVLERPPIGRERIDQGFAEGSLLVGGFGENFRAKRDLRTGSVSVGCDPFLDRMEKN